MSTPSVYPSPSPLNEDASSDTTPIQYSHSAIIKKTQWLKALYGMMIGIGSVAALLGAVLQMAGLYYLAMASTGLFGLGFGVVLLSMQDPNDRQSSAQLPSQNR